MENAHILKVIDNHDKSHRVRIMKTVIYKFIMTKVKHLCQTVNQENKSNVRNKNTKLTIFYHDWNCFIRMFCNHFVKFDCYEINWYTNDFPYISYVYQYSSLFISIEPKLDMGLFFDFFVFTWVWLNLPDQNLDVWCLDVQNNDQVNSVKFK